MPSREALILRQQRAARQQRALEQQRSRPPGLPPTRPGLPTPRKPVPPGLPPTRPGLPTPRKPVPPGRRPAPPKPRGPGVGSAARAKIIAAAKEREKNRAASYKPKYRMGSRGGVRDSL
jgi:hypothetical protein